MPDIVLPFLNNIGVKGPKTTYNNAKDIPGIWRFIQEYTQALD